MVTIRTTIRAYGRIRPVPDISDAWLDEIVVEQEQSEGQEDVQQSPVAGDDRGDEIDVELPDDRLVLQ